MWPGSIRWTRLTVVTMILFPLSMVTNGQTADAVPPDRSGPPGADAPPAEPQGLWPSPKLMNLMLLHWADEFSHQYELTSAQRTLVRDAVVKRWSPFFKENNSAIRPLVNEFIEMRLELEPPDLKTVQAWAKRAMPLFEQVREQINLGTADLREILNPNQRAKFERQVLELEVGLQAAEKRLTQLQRGDFDVRELPELWEPNAAERRKRRQERRRRMDNAGKTLEPGVTDWKVGPTIINKVDQEETDQIALELKAWEAYTEGFIRVYHLDEGQRSAVLSFLSELKQRAMAHRDTRREDIAKLEQRIDRFAGGDAELTELKEQLTELYGPIDEMFKELKHRIKQVPTAEQSRRAKE